MQVLALFFAIAAYAQSPTMIERARASYLDGFTQTSLEGVDRRCLMIDEKLLGFCREGYYASKVFSEAPENFLSPVDTSTAGFFFSREAALGFGIGSGENLDHLPYNLRVKVSSLKGGSSLRDYYIDGIGMGLFLHFHAEALPAIQFCRGFEFSEDRITCVFGVGRALAFSKKSREFSASEISSAERYHLEQGLSFAKVYAGRELDSIGGSFDPGNLAAASMRYLDIYAKNDRMKYQKLCNASLFNHHYVCGLLVLHPEVLFVWRN